MAPNLFQLKYISNKSNESFKEYVQIWREFSDRVQLPLSEKELVDMFMDTLQSPYFERMVGSASLSFSNLVNVREHIEGGLKSKRLPGVSSVQTIESESLRDSQEEDEDKTNSTSELTSIHKLYLRCLIINIYMQQLFNTNNHYSWSSAPATVARSAKSGSSSSVLASMLGSSGSKSKQSTLASKSTHTSKSERKRDSQY